MATESLRVSGLIPATPKQIYDAWLDSTLHTAMTRGKASVEGRVGGKYSAWDGYIRGETLELEANKRILQTWRTVDFPKGAPNSRLEITLQARKLFGTEITLVQTDLPEGQGRKYEEGWLDNYLTPMRRYFTHQAEKKAAAAAKAAEAPPPAEKKAVVKEKAVVKAKPQKPAKASMDRRKAKGTADKSKATPKAKSKAKAPAKTKKSKAR